MEKEERQKRCVTWLLFLFPETKSLYFDIVAAVVMTVKLVFLHVKLQRAPEMAGFVILSVGWLRVQYYIVATITSTVGTPCVCSLKGKFTGTSVHSIT
jgi:hypothetical protein